MRDRCASATMSRTYFCKSVGNLYHSDSYEMSANWKKLSVMNEPTKQNTKTYPVLTDAHNNIMIILGFIAFISCKRTDRTDRYIIGLFFP